MRIRNYPIYSTGLYVTRNDFADKNTYDELCNNGSLYQISKPDGEAMPIFEKQEYFETNEVFAIFELSKTASLFEQAYKSKEDALEELKENYSRYLPKDFNYKARFIEYWGTYYI